jgi:hypothetical protein
VGRPEANADPEANAGPHASAALPSGGSNSVRASSRLNRGLTVELLEIDGGEALIRADVLNYGVAPPTVISRREGWVDSGALGSLVVRHHVHLRHHGRGPLRWMQVADGHEFVPFWAPMFTRPEVCESQAAWLAFAYDRLLARTAG